MAKNITNKSEGHRPWQERYTPFDTRLPGFWDLVGNLIVYEQEDSISCPPDTKTCDHIFYDDMITYKLMKKIVLRGFNAEKILVHQQYHHTDGACKYQAVSDIHKIMSTSENPELIAQAGSNFIVVLADAPHGLDIWIWDLAVSQ